ncbi:MAG: hypothetical protein ABIN58_03660 [candidate division WOR-3 bacterium]
MPETSDTHTLKQSIEPHTMAKGAFRAMGGSGLASSLPARCANRSLQGEWLQGAVLPPRPLNNLHAGGSLLNLNFCDAHDAGLMFAAVGSPLFFRQKTVPPISHLDLNLNCSLLNDLLIPIQVTPLPAGCKAVLEKARRNLALLGCITL